MQHAHISRSEGLQDWRREFAAEGFVNVGPPAVPRDLLRRLATEARQRREDARVVGAGASVPQHNARARLGVVGKRFLTSQRTVRFLSVISGVRVAPSFGFSCYTYYDRPNDFCGVHRDRPGDCEVTLLVCLGADCDGESPSTGLSLSIFGPRYRKGQRAAMRLPSLANNLIVLRGSHLYHGRPRIAAGERATILTACYRRAD